jgi:hypothetical protein
MVMTPLMGFAPSDVYFRLEAAEYRGYFFPLGFVEIVTDHPGTRFGIPANGLDLSLEVNVYRPPIRLSKD